MPPAPPKAEPKAAPAPKPEAKPAAGAATRTPAPAPGKAEAAAPAGGATAAKPAGGANGARVDRLAVRAKLAVSTPGDAVEREADRAADTVMRAVDAEKSGGAPPPATVGRPAAQEVARAAEGDAPDRPTVPTDFAATLGTGRPLDPDVRATMERHFAHDFSRVRVHDDAAADSAARRINARAFTLGNHVAFVNGAYEPETPEGQRLIAHELAHVVQQDTGTEPAVMRQPAGAGGGGGAPAAGGGAASGAPEFRVTTPLQVPPIKSRHGTVYNARATRNVLRRTRGYSAADRRTGQVPNWTRDVEVNLDRIPQHFRPAAGGTWTLPLQQPIGAPPFRTVTGTAEEVRAALQRPAWGIGGSAATFQVDHMVEFQLSGEDDVSNYELLDQAHNGSVGSSFAAEINKAIRVELQNHPAALAPLPGVAMPSAPSANFVKENYDIVFTRIEGRGRQSRRGEGSSLFWSREQVEEAEPATAFLPPAPGDLSGTARQLSLLSPTGQVRIGRFPVRNDAVTVPRSAAGGIAGYRIETITLTGGIGSISEEGNEGAAVGQLEGTLNLGPAVVFPEGTRHGLALQKAAPAFAVKIASTPAPGPNGTTNQIIADFTPLSPMEISDVAIGNSVTARAFITPTHPVLSGLRIPGEIRNGRLGIFYVVDATAITQRLRIPGVTVGDASVTIGYDGTDLIIGGSAGFTIRNFGEGSLSAELDTSRKFALAGSFRPDPRLFDEANLNVWYRSEGGFGAQGRLAITNPNKIRGIRSLAVQARYENSVFAAEGTVEPSIPGLQSANLAVTYGPEPGGGEGTSLLIAGDLELAPGIPGLTGGRVHVEALQRDERWKLTGRGEIRPNLPALSPVITLVYDDGLFTGEASASFQRGIFSGDVTVGITNRAVTPEGGLSGTEPTDTLVIYGAGTIDARVTEWLRGGVGVKVKPTGQVLVSGRIGLAGALTVFDRYPPPGRDRRTLFTMPTVAIPLLGAPGAGVSLNISGRIEGYVFVGPGALTSAEISVIDYDPAVPDSLHVTGTARFEVPAGAGVDAVLNAGLAAGAVISLEAGLGVRAGVAVEANASQQVDVDYTPTTGLHLHAALSATVAPKLKFGIDGYARVTAGALGVSIELWRKDWRLAEREAGSNLALGLTAPIDYYSDARGLVFDPEAITFTVPELNADTIGTLLDNEGSEQRETREGDDAR